MWPRTCAKVTYTKVLELEMLEPSTAETELSCSLPMITLLMISTLCVSSYDDVDDDDDDDVDDDEED